MVNSDLAGDYRLLYPSEYLKSADLRGKDWTVTIRRLQWEEVTMNGGKSDQRVIAYLSHPTTGRELGKKLVLNKTNLSLIAASVGDPDVATWPGKKITLYADKTDVGGGKGKRRERKDCIRIRTRTAGANNGELPDEMTAAPAPRIEFADEAADEPGKDG